MKVQMCLTKNAFSIVWVFSFEKLSVIYFSEKSELVYSIVLDEQKQNLYHKFLTEVWGWVLGVKLYPGNSLSLNFFCNFFKI